MSAVERVVLIGAGPRGLAVLERICANARRSSGRYEIFVVDPAEPGAGAVWRSDQPNELLMNTVASQVSVFPDRSVSMRGPVESGPSLYEWAATITSDEGASQEGTVPLGPDDYPPRRLYGAYLSFAFRRVRDRAPVNVSIEAVKDVVVHLHPTDDSGRRHDVILRDGETIRDADHVVMSLGHGGVEPDGVERRLAAGAESWGGVYLRPMNPADAELDGIPPGENVILRGLGLNFFDYVALLTLGRDGSFIRDAQGVLRYCASGNEPRLFVGSRRGVPHHARGRNEKGADGRAPARLLDAHRVQALRRQHMTRPLRFKLDVWPLIARDVECTYYEAFITNRSERQEFARRYLHCAEHTRAAVLRDFALDTVPAWDWEQLARPWQGADLKSVSDYRSWIREYLLADVDQARLGNVSGPLKSALDLLRDLRNEIRSVIDHGGVEGQSYVDDIDGWYTPMNAFLSIGPPERRIEELVALMDAGVVTILGPGVTVDTSGSAFRASSSVFADAGISARHLIEARLPAVDARASQNPLISSMLSAGLLTLHSHPAQNVMIESGGIAVTRRPYRVLNSAYPEGHPRLFLYGVPTEAVHWVTAAGARPGVDSLTFRDADAIALAILDADSAEEIDHLDAKGAVDVASPEFAIR